MSDFVFDIGFPFFAGFIHFEGFHVGLDNGEWSFEFVGGVGDKKSLFVVGVFDRSDDFFGEIIRNKKDGDFDNNANIKQSDKEPGTTFLAVSFDELFDFLVTVI